MLSQRKGSKGKRREKKERDDPEPSIFADVAENSTAIRCLTTRVIVRSAVSVDRKRKDDKMGSAAAVRKNEERRE